MLEMHIFGAFLISHTDFKKDARHHEATRELFPRISSHYTVPRSIDMKNHIGDQDGVPLIWISENYHGGFCCVIFAVNASIVLLEH